MPDGISNGVHFGFVQIHTSHLSESTRKAEKNGQSSPELFVN